MELAIIASTKDPAGINIITQLKLSKSFPAKIGEMNVNLYVRDENITDLDNIDEHINADIYVFASRHVSKNNVHSLAVHSIGNWGVSKGGGRDNTLVACPTELLKLIFSFLVDQKLEGYEVIQEATHHGPYLEKPALFVEIGSDEQHYTDPLAGKAVSNALLNAILQNKKTTNAIGIGGLHHCPNFRKIMLGTQLCVVYVCPKYLLSELNTRTLKMAMQHSNTNKVILDWKGLGSEKQRILLMLTELSADVSRSSEY